MFNGKNYGTGESDENKRGREKEGEDGTWVLIVEMKEKLDKEEILEKGWEVRRK